MPRKAEPVDPSSVGEAGPEPLTTHTGCQQADTCPAAGQGPWLRHVDKDGQRSTVDNGDGTFWNRACPVQGCSIRVFG